MHRPDGIGGYKWVKTLRLSTKNCSSSIAKEHSFRNKDTEHAWVPYPNYYEYYPDWTIRSDADPDVEIYWKWFFAEYNEQLAEYYSNERPPSWWEAKIIEEEPNRTYRVLPADDIPSKWGEYTREEIMRNMEEHYHVKILQFV